MKKVLFVTLALAIGMTGFAQTKNMPVKALKKMTGQANIYKKAHKGINDAPIMSFANTQAAPVNSTRDAEYVVDHQTMMTHYDLQSNGYVSDRMHRFEDGTVALVATYSQLSNYSDRGTGYNYYNGSEFLFDCEENPIAGRVETEKTGWPCYAPYGPNGEMIIAHASYGSDGMHLSYYTRETKGEGAWQGPSYIPNPYELGAATCELTWPKLATSGANHDIIHVIGADQDSDNLADTYLFYSRSTDGETWTTTFVPTLEDWEIKSYSSDYYALAANGNTVAILLVGDVMAHTYVIKSDDNGETWKQIKVWNNPYAGLDWENDEASLFGCEDCDIYCTGPETGSICIDNNGMVHCAFSAHEWYHDELGTGYTFAHGKGVDGIFYWNENMGTLEPQEWVCPEDGYVMPADPMNVFRMWWPTSEPVGDDYYITRRLDAEPILVGFVDPNNFSDISNDDVYCEQDYYSFWQGASVLPAICVDESGAIAIGYSSIDADREKAENGKYRRSVYVSYIEYPYHPGDHYGEFTEEMGDVYYLEAKLQEAEDFLHSDDEAIAVMCPQNTTNMEFWFGYQADDTPGLLIPTGHTQSMATDNYIWATMLNPNLEGLDVEENVAASNTKMEIYPNPAVNQLNVRLENNAEISVYNIMGQNVLNMQGVKGVNTINVNDLTSGVYFISAGTVTQKFIVK